MSDARQGPFRVGDWRVEPTTGVVARGDTEERLEPKVMAVLVELAREPGRVVSKEELIERVWPETFVGEAALSRCISELRRTLGDDARDPRYIETLTKRGYRLLAAVQPASAGGRPGTPEDEAEEPRVRWNRIVAGLVVAALFVAWWSGRPAPDASALAVRSLAVLPLRALTEDAVARQLADGLGQQLVAALATLEGVEVRGTDATREAVREGSGIADAARDLDVDALVTGTVQVSGDRTLIGLELVHVASRTDLWAGSYQEIDEDPLEIEHEVAEAAVREIAAALAARNGETPPREPADPEARRLLERGRTLADRTRPADALRALEHFQEALRVEPGYARAWAAVADLQAELGWHHWSPAAEAYRDARAAAYEALDLDPRLPEAHAVLGAVAAEANWDWPEAERLFETATTLGPEVARVRERYGRFLRRLGRVDEALVQSERAVALAPDWLAGQTSHGWNLLLADRHDAAREALLRAVEMDDDLVRALEGLCALETLAGTPEAALAACRRATSQPGNDHLVGVWGHALARAGRPAAAERILAELRESPSGEATALAEATVLMGLERREEALAAFGRAVAGRSIQAAAVLADPFLRDLRQEPGFEAFLERMAIPLRELP